MANIGDVVGIRIGSGGKARVVDAVVFNRRWIDRGRFAGRISFTMALFEKTTVGRTEAFAVKIASGTGEFEKPSKEYTKAEIESACKVIREAFDKREAFKEARKERMVERAAELGAKVGDEVLVRYTHGVKRWEKVVGVNGFTGKIGIEVPGQIMSQVERRTQTGYRTSFAEYTPKKVRWIRSNCIIEVRSAMAKAAEAI